MSVKKIISLSASLLANIFILAHAVVPHHHHDNVPIALSHRHEGADCRTAHRHLLCPCENSDGGEGRDSGEECFLKQGFTGVEERGHGEFCHCGHHSVAIQVDFCNPVPEIHASAVEAAGPPPVLKYHYSYLTRSLGLRAPPVC